MIPALNWTRISIDSRASWRPARFRPHPKLLSYAGCLRLEAINPAKPLAIHRDASGFGICPGFDTGPGFALEQKPPDPPFASANHRRFESALLSSRPRKVKA